MTVSTSEDESGRGPPNAKSTSEIAKPELEQQNAALRANLREMFCPRPCNHRPSEFDVGDCVAAGECGCGANHALSDSTPTPLQEQNANGGKEEG